MRRISQIAIAFSIAFFSSVFAQSTSIYQDYTAQAEKIYAQMSVDERIGQLIMPSYVLLANSVSPQSQLCKAAINGSSKEKIIHDCGLNLIKQYHLGSALTGGGPFYNAPTLQNWANLNAMAVEQHRLGSPHDPLLLTGNDAVHGNIHVQGAVIFPHAIGLGVAHDAALLKQIGELVGQDSLASGFNWVYAPLASAAQDLRWGRTYESFGQEVNLVKSLTQAYIEGFQNIQNDHIQGVLATAKHFIGDNATQYGFDEGDDAYQGNERNFWLRNGMGYEGAINADVGSIMASYSAINSDNTRMHFGGMWDIINKFKNNGIVGSDNKMYKFNGLIVSDWNGATRAAYFYQKANNATLSLSEIFAKSINGGVDILMSAQDDVQDPFNPSSTPNFTTVGQVFDAVKSAYQQGLISDARLKDAVVRILSVKLAIAPKKLDEYASIQAKERDVALKAAQQSLVLLKNDKKLLPLTATKTCNVIFIGETNDLGLQNGGWTVNWQGQKGNAYFTGKDKITSGAMTLEEGIKHKLNKNVKYYYANDKVNTVPSDLSPQNTIAIAVVAEVPYAEFMGDIGNSEKIDNWYELGAKNGYNLYLGMPQSHFLGLKFSNNKTKAIKALKQKGIKVITVIYSGRPIILTEGNEAAPLNNSNALIAAFLPGTLGGKALANAIFGDYRFKSNSISNTLTFPWPRDMNDVANHFKNGALFPIGYGLKD